MRFESIACPSPARGSFKEAVNADLQKSGVILVIIKSTRQLFCAPSKSLSTMQHSQHTVQKNIKWNQKSSKAARNKVTAWLEQYKIKDSDLMRGLIKALDEYSWQNGLTLAWPDAYDMVVPIDRPT